MSSVSFFSESQETSDFSDSLLNGSSKYLDVIEINDEQYDSSYQYSYTYEYESSSLSLQVADPVQQITDGFLKLTSKNNLKSLSSLVVDYDRLVSLHLQNMKACDLSQVSLFQQLIELNISFCPSFRTTFFTKDLFLQKLTITDSNLSSLDGIHHLTHLTYLNLENNNLTQTNDFIFLQSLINLSFLSFVKNPLIFEPDYSGKLVHVLNRKIYKIHPTPEFKEVPKLFPKCIYNILQLRKYRFENRNKLTDKESRMSKSVLGYKNQIKKMGLKMIKLGLIIPGQALE
ncbi:Leucine-rich_repeat domain superfamily [Hexamita inflata]|uniref:Leucine-rich repeat domain superfamily n=1 Tax=Hexamita inflata TaxID=28002 RepID=A0AA86Q7V0_9EUKA|nr:Leucine-rich repeat domain superfamily [Hexamita inflata]